jgi:hypothetical protein
VAVASLRPSLPFLASTPEIARLATGDTGLDGLLDGGFVRGQLTEVVGAPSTGRTSLAHRLLSAATRRGEIVALVDAADRFDPRRAEAAGIDLARLLWVRPPDPVGALRACEVLLSTRGFGVVTLDLADGIPSATRARLATVWSRLRLRAASSRTIFLLLARDRLSAGTADVCLTLRERRPLWSRSSSSQGGVTLLDGIEARVELVRTRHGTPGARERVQFLEG